MQSLLYLSIVQHSSINPSTAEGLSDDVTNDVLAPGCICEIGGGEKSTDTIWFVRILERCEADLRYTIDYSFKVAKGQ